MTALENERSAGTIRVETGRIGTGLLISIGTISYLGLCAEVWEQGFGLPDRLGLVDFLSLSEESNLPTWCASMLHGIAALLLMATAASRAGADRDRRFWWLLAAVFTYISLDESVQLHENMNAWFDWGGVLYFGWVVPAAVAVALLGFSLLGFLRRLPPRLRIRMLWAAGFFVGGAIGVELLLAGWTDAQGSENIGYALIDWVEETLEFVGIGVFVHALIDHLATAEDPRLVVEIRPSSPRLGRRRVVRLASLALLSGLLAGGILAGGFSTHHRYADDRGIGPTLEAYEGPDLAEVLRGGGRFRYVGPERRFDHAPGPRLMLVFGCGGMLLVASAIWGRRPSGSGAAD